MLTPHAAPSTTVLALEAKFTALDLKVITEMASSQATPACSTAPT